jgi:hypothetical protein
MGPWLLGGLLARSVYRSTCEGRVFYGGADGPAHLTDILATTFFGFLTWEIREPIARAGFAVWLISELIRWRWTLTGSPVSQRALWGTYLVSWLLLTIAAMRGATIRRQALAVALLAAAFALAWWSTSVWDSFRDLRSVLHSAPWC